MPKGGLTLMIVMGKKPGKGGKGMPPPLPPLPKGKKSG